MAGKRGRAYGLLVFPKGRLTVSRGVIVVVFCAGGGVGGVETTASLLATVQRSVFGSQVHLSHHPLS